MNDKKPTDDPMIPFWRTMGKQVGMELGPRPDVEAAIRAFTLPMDMLAPPTEQLLLLGALLQGVYNWPVPEIIDAMVSKTDDPEGFREEMDRAMGGGGHGGNDEPAGGDVDHSA